MEPETAGQEAAAADAGEVSQEEAKQPGHEEVRGAQGSHTKCKEVNITVEELMTCLMPQVSQLDDQTSSTPAAAEAPGMNDHAEQSQDPAPVEPEASYQHVEVVQAVEQAAASTSGMTTDWAAWHACPPAPACSACATNSSAEEVVCHPQLIMARRCEGVITDLVLQQFQITRIKLLSLTSCMPVLYACPVMTCNRVAGRDNGDSTHRSTMTHSSGVDLDSEMVHSLSAQTSSLALSSRPQSAAAGPPVRGSRPNSAAIAATIEGFENDFMVSTTPVFAPALGCALPLPWCSGGCLAAFPADVKLPQLELIFQPKPVTGAQLSDSMCCVGW
jgi:hypothetical protein